MSNKEKNSERLKKAREPFPIVPERIYLIFVSHVQRHRLSEMDSFFFPICAECDVI